MPTAPYPPPDSEHRFGDTPQPDASSQDQVIARIVALEQAGDWTPAIALAVSLWETGTPAQRNWAAWRMPNVLANMGRLEEALRIYSQAVAEGLIVGDFRIHTTQSSLALSNPESAARLHHRDRNAFMAALEHSATTACLWAPVVDLWGVVTLRGATPKSAADAVFELHIAGVPAPRRAPAVIVQQAGEITHWQALVDDLLPGQKTTVRLVAGDAISPPLPFALPGAQDDEVITSAGDVIGIGGAVLAGKIAQGSANARYRFEYGEGALDRATPWLTFPPPRTARAYKPLYRHTGEWKPTCVNPYWIHNEAPSGAPADPGMALGAPFSKDRNQLTGIGAHEMPVGFNWAWSDHSTSWGLGGRHLDLRDAEITFTIAGDKLDWKGSALHYWASHAAADTRGKFISQWALTAAPFPDDALATPAPYRVTMALPSDPRAWTYTGNNPQEQGARASRYRRAPLDATLSEINAGSVLIFAFGDVRHPPTGALVLYATEVRHRDHSILSPAGQARLTAFPAQSLSDPLNLTLGWRGHDSHLWTSGAAPVFPIAFTWELANPVALTHFTICQHPYWPARDLEIIAADEDGVRRTLWAGALSEGRADLSQPQYVSEPLSGIAATSITVLILSAYHPERCGLDCVAFYGNGAVFNPDGTPGTFSTEVSGLTPGATLTYRIVLEADGEVRPGAVMSIVLPRDSAPILESAAPRQHSDDPACYVIRANAMGLDTELWGELQAGDKVFAGPRIYLGSQPTGRHIYYTPEAIPDLPGVFHLRARNAAGEASLPTTWPPA